MLLCSAPTQHPLSSLLSEHRVAVPFIWVLTFHLSVCSGLSYESTWSLWVWPCWASAKWGSCLLWCIKAEVCLSSASEKLLVGNSKADFVLVLVRHNIHLEKSYFYAVNNGIFRLFIVAYVLFEYDLNIAWNKWVWINNLSASMSWQHEALRHTELLYITDFFENRVNKDHLP